MERICIMHKGETLQPEHLPKELTQGPGGVPLQAEPFDYPIPREGIDLEAVVDEFATHLIRNALRMADGNISQAAKLLKIPRGTLRYKIEKMPGERLMG
jgi:DNA-binding NtrC family response regulator